MSRKIFFLTLFILFTFFSCDLLFNSSSNNEPHTVSHSFSNLQNNDIFLIKINKGDLVVNASDAGSVIRFTSRSVTEPVLDDEDFPLVLEIDLELQSSLEGIIRPGHPFIDEFNANHPLPIRRSGFTSSPLASPPLSSPPVRSVGDKKNFWVERYFTRGDWLHRPATLAAIGTHSNVWVMDGDTEIPKDRAELVAQLFDIIYPAATALLGYEHGGGPGGNGGLDGDTRVQILIYDIITPTGAGAAGGYFWGKDFYPFINGIYYSNEAEMFYVHSSQVLENRHGWIPHLLIHEFQHLIHFSNKRWLTGQVLPTWYNEMMSMMAEDLVYGIIASNPSSPITLDQVEAFNPIRLGTAIGFMDNYHREGITDWNLIGNASYTNAYIFGSYLMRNYGGAALLNRMSLNSTTGIPSINQALAELRPGTDFLDTLYRFGEALVSRGSSHPANAAVFNRTVTSNVNGRSYTLRGYDLYSWNFALGPGGSYAPRVSARWIHNLTPIQLRPHSAVVHSDPAWINITGDITIMVAPPLNPNVEYYFIVR